MKKKISLFIFLFSCLMIGSVDCYAASASIKSSTSSTTKGNKVKITLTISADSPLVSIEGTLKCSGAGVNSGEDLRFDDSSNSVYSKTYTHTVTPSSAGTLSCYTEGVRLTEMSKDTWQNVSDKKVSVTIKNPQVIAPKEYSSNNNLSSLSIDGFKFDKSFDKGTLEYSIELPNGTEKIKINASAEDKTAKVSGVGEVSVSEGTNKIEVKVTAENGNIKTYIINALVKELDPILVEVNNKNYNIVRKEGVLEPIEGYEKTSVTINEEEVLAYYNETTKYTLLILKDEDGNSSYYVYDNNKYTPYKEYNFSGVRLQLIESNKLDNTIESEFSINDEKIKAYQFDLSKKNVTYAAPEEGISDYYLIYAMNINTGNKDYYLIDKKENTAIRYNEEMRALFLDSKLEGDYKTYFFITLGVLGVTILIFGITLIAKGNKNKHKFNF